jgi:putative peptidoglycan lipid II flippase
MSTAGSGSDETPAERGLIHPATSDGSTANGSSAGHDAAGGVGKPEPRYSWSQLGPSRRTGGHWDERGYDGGGHVRLVQPRRQPRDSGESAITANGRGAHADGGDPGLGRSWLDNGDHADGMYGPVDIGLYADAEAPTRVYSYQWGPTQAGPGWYGDETGPVPVVRDDDRVAGASVVSASGVMAVGTLVSRVSGMLRTLVQAWALGAVALANAYNNANTLPNVVYNLVLGGILTSVIVPLIVSAKKRESDGGEAYDQRMFTLITAALLGITVLATILASPIVDIYKGSISGTELHVMIIFAYFFIPQIFFYGMSSLIGAILNSRGSFAAPMWTPVVNNLVVIAILLLYFSIAGSHAGNVNITPDQVRLLGIGTTIGIVAQTAALLPALRRVGFRWRPRFDFRRVESAQIGRMAGWMFCYVGATQVVFLVTAIVCNVAAPGGNGYTSYTYAWQLFQMPYAVVGISVITALLPRMSAHASERRYGLVKQDFSVGVRLASVIVVPSALILAVLGPELALVLFAHFKTDIAQAHYMGVVFALFCLGLLPYMLFQLQLRVFYSLHDSRTPALIGLATMTLNIAASFVALAVLPGRDVVAGLGVAFGLANLLGAIVAWRVLSVRLDGLDGRVIGTSLVRMHVAAIPAALFALFVSTVAGVLAPGEGRLSSLLILLVGGAGGLVVYLRFAQALRVREVNEVGGALVASFRRYR